MNNFAKLGQAPNPDQTKGAWHLDVSEYLSPIDPHTYFQTSGEAIAKTDKLILDLQEQLKQARKLKRVLIKTRDTNKYLETEWIDGGLVLKTKNTRKKP